VQLETAYRPSTRVRHVDPAASGCGKGVGQAGGLYCATRMRGGLGLAGRIRSMHRMCAC